ncbi:hypothetical protein PVAP13_3KG419427 [Panicum virgatum]|uniref:Uncharacterized protein n=1 Tax=Panicum virgatum TaxID=38727 RepID=A0A8T0V660_PANVG|nr:hypothetical protein PVAP13_3KG419427 [Panicum virgatum]
MMHSNGEVEYEEELDFHLETASDTSLDNDNTLSGQNSYSDKDGNAGYELMTRKY